jgi:hypothetical protein
MEPSSQASKQNQTHEGLPLSKCIYLTIHHPKIETPVTSETQALFDQGNTVRTKAREYYLRSVLIDNKSWDFSGALAKTSELLATNTSVIYKAAFEYMGCYASADIIQYSHETKPWRIFKVKSSTRIQTEHYWTFHPELNTDFTFS